MTHEEFNKFQEGLHAEIVAMRDTKGKEYANGEDRFGNFNRTAANKSITRLQVAGVFLDKHLDAINSYVKNGKVFSTENIRGRFIDAILYLELMAGMAAEEETSKVGNAIRPDESILKCPGNIIGRHCECYFSSEKETTYPGRCCYCRSYNPSIAPR